MRIPKRYYSSKEGSWIFGPIADEQGRPLTWADSMAYPPPGFLHLPLFELGNGDQAGFWWPIGREDGEPIVCEMLHDESRLVAVAATLEDLAVLYASEESAFQRDDARWLAQCLDLSAAQSSDTVPASPEALLRLARIEFGVPNLSRARVLLDRALEILPEHADSWFALASLERRERKQGAAVAAVLRGLACPRVFSSGSEAEKLLGWISRLPDDCAAEVVTDPIWARRKQLSQARGDWVELLGECIDEYVQRGDGVLAARCAMRRCELDGGQLQRLAAAFERAGLNARLAAFVPSPVTALGVGLSVPE